VLGESAPRAAMASSGVLSGTDNEVLIESSYRQLLATINVEREKIRSSHADTDRERSRSEATFRAERREIEEYSNVERQKIDIEWKRLDKLRERMSMRWPDPGASENIEINCSGKLFTLPRRLIASIEGSHLNHMFSDAYVASIPLDAEGRFYLDFNPFCFGLMMDYLHLRCDRPDAVPPPVSPDQQQNMDMLADALDLKAFMPINKPFPGHGSSLKLSSGSAEGRSVIEAGHPGWQVIGGAYPLPMASIAYFEVNVVANSEARGGLAVGICSHIPQGSEIHTIRLVDSIMYNSAVGLIGDSFAAENVTKGIVLAEGSCFGIKYDAYSRRLEFFFNRVSIGTAALKVQCHEKFQQIYPVVALNTKGQKIDVNFLANSPFAKGGV